MTVTDRVRDLVLPLLSERSLDLYDVEMQGSILRVVVDTPAEVAEQASARAPGAPTGPDLDAIAEVTRAVSRALDEADPIAGRYTLEVTSPGVERRLRTPEHFRRAIGETVKIRTVAGVADQRRVEGVLTTADDTGVVVGSSGEGAPVEHRLAYADIERARTVFQWGPAPDKGRRGPARRRHGRSESQERERRT